MLARVRWRIIISIFLYLTRTYDCVLRRIIFDLVSEKYSKFVAGIITQIFQCSIVFTQGDETGVRSKLGSGLTQRPFSSDLFNIFMDTLIGTVKELLKVLQHNSGSSDCSLLFGLVNDVVIQPGSDVETAIALRAAEGWARRTSMKFHLVCAHQNMV